MNPRPRLFVVEKLRQLCDPTQSNPWDGFKRPISPREVEKAVKENRLAGYNNKPGWVLRVRKTHIERIAYFVVHGWADPIELDVGIPSLNFHVEWPIQDGNHRFFAALVRGDQRILGSASGQVTEINRLCRSPRVQVAVARAS